MPQIPSDQDAWIEYRIIRLHRPSHENWSLFAAIRVPGYTWMFDAESFRDEDEAVSRLGEIAEMYGVSPKACHRKPPLFIRYWW